VCGEITEDPEPQESCSPCMYRICKRVHHSMYTMGLLARRDREMARSRVWTTKTEYLPRASDRRQDGPGLRLIGMRCPSSITAAR
jgi:hypothetical protein